MIGTVVPTKHPDVRDFPKEPSGRWTWSSHDDRPKAEDTDRLTNIPMIKPSCVSGTIHGEMCTDVCGTWSEWECVTV